MSYAEFAPVKQSTTQKDTKEPVIIDVPQIISPSPAPTSIHVSYPFKVTKDEETSWTWSVAFISFFALIWVIAGIVAFIMSLVCFARNGTAIEKIVGFLLALFFGPFYWVYYSISASYCKTA
jgi:small neutral amino acid transporter SnatA (MarC family)